MCQPQSFLGQHEVVGDASLLLKHHHQKLHTDLEKVNATIKNYFCSISLRKNENYI